MSEEPLLGNTPLVKTLAVVLGTMVLSAGGYLFNELTLLRHTIDERGPLFSDALERLDRAHARIGQIQHLLIERGLVDQPSANSSSPSTIEKKKP